MYPFPKVALSCPGPNIDENIFVRNDTEKDSAVRYNYLWWDFYLCKIAEYAEIFFVVLGFFFPFFSVIESYVDPDTLSHMGKGVKNLKRVTSARLFLEVFIVSIYRF